MALPSIVLPPELPMWLRAGYEALPQSAHGHAEMSVGHSRTRQLTTGLLRRESVSLKLVNETQLLAWHEFFEETLEAGRLPFAARVANLGPGTRWFDALVLDYESVPAPGGVTTINASLLLRGAPSLTGPT